jgi:hypothetical protein
MRINDTDAAATVPAMIAGHDTADLEASLLPACVASDPGDSVESTSIAASSQ